MKNLSKDMNESLPVWSWMASKGRSLLLSLKSIFEACNYFDAMKRRLGVKHRRLERGQSFPNFTVRGQTCERGHHLDNTPYSYFPPNTKELFLFNGQILKKIGGPIFCVANENIFEPLEQFNFA